MVVLRFKDRRPRAWRVPFNLRVGGVELPVGLILIFLVLLATALINLADQEGRDRVGHRLHRRLLRRCSLVASAVGATRARRSTQLEKFNVRLHAGARSGGARLGAAAVQDRAGARSEQPEPPRPRPARKPSTRTSTSSCRPSRSSAASARQRRRAALLARGAGASSPRWSTCAEEHGKTVIPLVVTSNDVLFAIARTAQELGATRGDLRSLGQVPARLPGSSRSRCAGARCEPDARREIVVRVVSEHEDLRFSV